jgi:hypothetical protein
MEGREKPHTDKYKDIRMTGMMMYAYITSSLGLRKFQVLDFCCIKCTRNHESKRCVVCMDNKEWKGKIQVQ